MTARSKALRIASVVACAASVSGCLSILDLPVFVAHDASSPRDAFTSDSFASDAADHSLDVGLDASLDARTDGTSLDTAVIDVAIHADHVTDAVAIDVFGGTDALSIDAPVGFIGPAAVSCSAAAPSPSMATYVGTTCAGMDLGVLSCNGTGHREVVIRIDGLPGQIWDITLSGGLAYAMHLGTSCDTPPISCGAGTVSDGGPISDGPFPAARTDYFVIETVSPTPCGTYNLTVTLR